MKDFKIKEIIELPIDEITPYDKNAKKHPKEQVQAIMNSISEFGMCDPIGVYGENNIIVEGHGRFEACKKLHFETIPCVRLDHLTDEERRAYTLAHNKVAESGWDFSLVDDEINDLPEFNFEDFGFEFVEEEEKPKKNERLRTDEAYNLPQVDLSRCDGYYQMPELEGTDYIPENLIGFNYALSAKDKNVGVHFYLDDYQFERLWNKPLEYIEVLQDFECCFTPDWSLYLDMPIAMKIWNTFRSRLIGQLMQDAGLIVIPTVSWAEKETFDFCFDGLPENSVLTISTIGVKKNSDAFEIWAEGVKELIKRKHPSCLLVYGGEVDFDYGDTKVIYFQNSVTERMRKSKKK